VYQINDFDNIQQSSRAPVHPNKATQGAGGGDQDMMVA